jgi:hypothetical protein
LPAAPSLNSTVTPSWSTVIACGVCPHRTGTSSAPASSTWCSVCPVQGQTGTDTVPQVGHLDVEEQASAVVGDP